MQIFSLRIYCGTEYSCMSSLSNFFAIHLIERSQLLILSPPLYLSILSTYFLRPLISFSSISVSGGSVKAGRIWAG